jgi:hypothetical protein
MPTDLRCVQLGLNSADLTGSLRLYSEALGFTNAGAQALWGDMIGLQGLPPDCRAIVWWMVGGQDFFQLEIFNHGKPVQRPMRRDWRPCDHGWVRFGIAVADFDRCLAALARQDVALTGRAEDDPRRRRAAFRDPFIGVMVELIEERGVAGPAVVYATSSVGDLHGARHYYETVIGLEIEPLENLHQPRHEALWGLAGAEREGFVARVGDFAIEVLAYTDPRGRPRAPDYRASDQGMVNIALNGKDVATIKAVFDRLASFGYVPPRLAERGDVIGGYITDPERELEFMSFPAERRASLGYAPSDPFLA